MSQDSYAPERRPLASRERKASKAVAHWLAIRGVSPNAISVAGMVAGIAAGCAFAATSRYPPAALWFLAAAALIQLRLLANMFDGMVAIETRKASPVGELFNEVPDRVSDTAMFVGAGYAAGGNPALGFIAACLAVFLAYVRAQGKVAGAHSNSTTWPRLPSAGCSAAIRCGATSVPRRPGRDRSARWPCRWPSPGCCGFPFRTSPPRS